VSKQKLNWRGLGLPVYIVLAFLLVFGALFLFELVSFNPTPAEETLTPGQYSEVVNALLEDADPANGNILLDTYGCAACHRIGAVNGIAPSFVGIVERAADIRPPLTAAEYIYESIVHPSAHLVESYANSMAQDYGTRIPSDELGDIIAYLLTPDAQ
jgi:hypothetical protein